MRTLTVLLILLNLLGLLSCNIPSSQKNNLTDNFPDTTGYFAARNMKGLASFKIGESTYQEILSLIQEEIRKDSKRFKETNYKELSRYNGYQEKYLDYKYDKKGNIASQFYREDFGALYREIKYDTISDFLKEDILSSEVFGCPSIRELEMFEYYVGDIEINSLKLRFYRDTLYQIACLQNDEIEEGFKAKYGIGRSYDNSIERGDKILKINKKLIRENESIRAESMTYVEYKYNGDKYEGASYSNSYFTIILKNEKIVKQIKDCENVAALIKERLQARNKQKDINRL